MFVVILSGPDFGGAFVDQGESESDSLFSVILGEVPSVKTDIVVELLKEAFGVFLVAGEGFWLCADFFGIDSVDFWLLRRGWCRRQWGSLIGSHHGLERLIFLCCECSWWSRSRVRRLLRDFFHGCFCRHVVGFWGCKVFGGFRSLNDDLLWFGFGFWCRMDGERWSEYSGSWLLAD